MLKRLRIWWYSRRLEKLIAAAQRAPATVEYRKRREAALKGWRTQA